MFGDRFQCNIDGQRTLIYFPIMHSQADMGGLGEAVKKMEIEKIGIREWSRKVKVIEKYWSRIELCLGMLDFRYDRTRLYQDGLPVCGKEHEIVRELAEKGGHNHRLLQMLMDKGAMLMGTESPGLLKEEYELVKSAMRPVSGDPVEAVRFKAEQREASGDILRRRDAFIANRVDETLYAGEAGVLFLGMFHHALELMPQDIRIIQPLPDMGV